MAVRHYSVSFHGKGLTVQCCPALTVTGDMYVSQKHRSVPLCWWHKHYTIQSNSLLERLSKQVSKDLSNLSNWFRANKLSLNMKKTELVIFRPRKLKTDHSFKLKLDGKRLVPTITCLIRLHSFIHFFWFYIKKIILSGDVETNPGPQSKCCQEFSICYWNLNSIATYSLLLKSHF